MHSDSQLSFSIRALFALGMLGLTLALMHFAADYLNALLLAWLIVLVASPLLYWMRGKGAPNWLSFVATLLAILIAFIGFGLIMILGFNQLVEAIPTYVEQTEELTNYLNQWIDSLGMNMGSVGETGTARAPPATMRTVMVSPMARPTPSIIAAVIPESAAGIETGIIVSHLVAPRA